MLRILIFLLLSFKALTATANDLQQPYIPSVIPTKEEVLRVKHNDVAISCDNPKNVIIEYSSLACPHCAHYYQNVFPKIKAELINKCKVKYVYRDFPTTRSALKAAGVIRCIATQKNKMNSEEFMRLIQMLFSSQASWAFSNEYEDHLKKLLSISGIPQDKITFCMQNNDILNEVISNSFTSMKALNMSHSPSIFLNGVELKNTSYEFIVESLQKE